MFGNKRKQEELEATVLAAKRLLATDDLHAMQQAERSIRDAWFDAGTPEGEALELIHELELRIERLKRKPYEQALRPCTNCRGREFRISNERDIEHVGKFRLVVCESCCATLMFWVKRNDQHHQLELGELVAVPDAGGPFR